MGVRYKAVVIGCLVGLLWGWFFALHKDAPRPVLSLDVQHERPTWKERSRCDECVQPGDLVKARIHGSSDKVGGVAVYRNDEHVSSCLGCTDLMVVVDLLGSYQIVGFQMRPKTSCTIPKLSLDHDVSTLQGCDADVVISRIDVR